AQLARSGAAAGPTAGRAATESPVEVNPDSRTVTIRPAAQRKKSRSAQAYDLDRKARQLYRERKYDQALKNLEQAVQLKPDDPVLLNTLGFLFYVIGRYDAPRSYLKKTLPLPPRRKEAHGNIAHTYMKLGRREDAKQHYEQY